MVVIVVIKGQYEGNSDEWCGDKTRVASFQLFFQSSFLFFTEHYYKDPCPALCKLRKPEIYLKGSKILCFQTSNRTIQLIHVNKSHAWCKLWSPPTLPIRAVGPTWVSISYGLDITWEGKRWIGWELGRFVGHLLLFIGPPLPSFHTSHFSVRNQSFCHMGYQPSHNMRFRTLVLSILKFSTIDLKSALGFLCPSIKIFDMEFGRVLVLRGGTLFWFFVWEIKQAAGIDSTKYSRRVYYRVRTEYTYCSYVG